MAEVVNERTALELWGLYRCSLLPIMCPVKELMSPILLASNSKSPCPYQKVSPEKGSQPPFKKASFRLRKVGWRVSLARPTTRSWKNRIFQSHILTIYQECFLIYCHVSCEMFNCHVFYMTVEHLSEC